MMLIRLCAVILYQGPPAPRIRESEFMLGGPVKEQPRETSESYNVVYPSITLWNSPLAMNKPSNGLQHRQKTRHQSNLNNMYCQPLSTPTRNYAEFPQVSFCFDIILVDSVTTDSPVL